jgi:two-component system, sensor histidine kinase FlrB
MASTVQTLPASMTSLPMPTWSDQAPVCPSAAEPKLTIGNLNAEDEQFLLHAFHTFSEAAGSLEKSYATLRSEVGRLRQELEKSNRDLAQSLEENRSVRAHLDRILEGLPCGVLVVSCDGQITRANPEACRLLGLAQDGGASPGFVSTLPSAVGRLLACARHGTGEQELNIQCDSGEKRWLAARHASIVESNTSASVYILRDVSERKRLEETQAKLGREQALAEMSTVLAHEIRNPLGSLELFAGLLAESDIDPECRKWVEHMQAGLRTLAATVNNVLHFHSMPEPERTPVDLGELLAWARDFFAPLTRQSGVTLSLQNGVPGVFVAADRHRLEQVLSNLVLNALRAMPEGGWIELAGRKAPCGDTVELVVSDTGTGISTEDLPHIFDAGFSTRSGSPGLGLAVCRKIVEQHGGEIRASASKSGTNFTLVLPVMELPVTEQRVIGQAAPEQSAPGATQ